MTCISLDDSRIVRPFLIAAKSLPQR